MQIAKCKISFRIAAAVLIALVMVFSACRSRPNSVATDTASPPQSPVSSNPEGHNLRIVRDDLDREILVPTKITRVVSTAPSVTEMIFAAGGGDRLVGVTTFCNYPKAAKEIAKIGDTMNPNMESIVALKPDVVFVSTASQIEAFTKTLEQNGIAVYVMDPTSIHEIALNLLKLGELFDTSETALKVWKNLTDRQMEVFGKVRDLAVKDEAKELAAPELRKLLEMERTRVFLQISNEPLFTIGKQSFLNDLFLWARGQSVTEEIETAYPMLSKETALALQPEVIILSASDDNREPNEVFRNSPAVKNGRVYSIDADILSRPGPRLVDALEQIAKLLHPEKFRDN